MKVELHDIIPALQPFIQTICSIENPVGSPAPSTFRVLPDTCVEIFFGYNNSSIAKIEAKEQFDSTNSFITSRMSRYMDVLLPPNSSAISVCFYPGTAFRFFPLPMRELSDNIVLLSDVWKGKTSQLEDAIVNINNSCERVSFIQDYLLNLIQQKPINTTAYEYCSRQILLFKGQMPLQELSEKIGISRRQLNRQFNAFLGLTPKEFSRVARFLNSLNTIKRFPSLSLTQIAYESGYFD